MDQDPGFENGVNYEELYRGIIQEMELMHKDNMRKLKIGFRSLLIVPTIFLILLFFTGSSKTVFLILWIVSMFVIAVVLVRIEYSDYQLQGRINHATDREGAEATSLMEESIESNRSAMHELLEREESRLPFKLGLGARLDGTDEDEYDDSGLPEISEDPDLEPYYSEETLSHDYDEFMGSRESGLTEDDSVFDDSPDFSDVAGTGAFLQPADDDEPGGIAISVIDDDADSIDTLLSDEADDTADTAAEPAQEAVPSAAAADGGQPEYASVGAPSEVEPPQAADSGPSQELAADLSADEDTDLGEDTGLGIDGPEDFAVGDFSLGADDSDELPGTMSVEDILSEYHRGEAEADYEADFSELGDTEVPDFDLSDTLGGLSDGSDDDAQL